MFLIASEEQLLHKAYSLKHCPADTQPGNIAAVYSLQGFSIQSLPACCADRSWWWCKVVPSSSIRTLYLVNVLQDRNICDLVEKPAGKALTRQSSGQIGSR